MLLEGELFDRIPSELHHVKTEGTHPLYGRIILDVVRVSKHKLVILLGHNVAGKTRRDARTTKETVIAIYGEIDVFVDNIRSIPYE